MTETAKQQVTPNPLPPADQKHSIRNSDFFRIFLRSFFIQAMWNFRSLISVGFAISLFPVARSLCRNEGELRSFLQRHLKFFNAHPYMASYALGVSARLEEMYVGGEAGACEKLEQLKELLISILGARGDRLFWFTLKPFSLILGLSMAYLLASPPWQVTALAAAFVFYNLPHFYLRYRGIVEGYRQGMEVYRCFQGENFKALKMLSLGLGTAGFILFLAKFSATFVLTDLHQALAVAVAVIATLICGRFTQNIYLKAGIVLVIAVVMGVTFH